MYGLKQLGNNWYKCLQYEIIAINFFQSRVDKCILLVYIDGCRMFSPDKAVLNTVIYHLGSIFKITPEDDVGSYICLAVSTNSAGYLVLRQPGLIDKVIATCHLENESNEHTIPKVSIHQAPTNADEPCQCTRSCHLVIGLLNYIAASS
jgi:hypothetical protein